MELKPPRVSLVRNIIESIGDGLYPGERKPPGSHKRVPYDIDYEKLCIALMYQYLVAGRAAEVTGKYRPRGEPLENAYSVRIGDKEAVIFTSKKGWSAHRKTPLMRGICIPLDRGYEPWAREVFDYVTSYKNPFTFKEKDLSNTRILTATCEYIFNTLIWHCEWNEPIPGYSSIKETDKTTFTNDSLYWLRLHDLKHKYNFPPNDLQAFTKTIGRVTIDNNTSWARVRDVFLNIGESYFRRLCVSLKQ